MGNNNVKINVDRTNTIEQTIQILNQIKTFDLHERETINVNGEILKDILRAYYELAFCHEQIIYPISSSKYIR